jgi:hypothetical protein
MIVRTYRIWTYSNQQSKKVTRFVVDDALDEDETRPSVAEFIVSEAYPVDVQRARANEYSAYMNRIAEATKNAYSENLLADKLKGSV